MPTLTLALDEVGDDWPLIRSLMDDPVYAAEYHDLLVATLDGPFAVDEHSARAQQLWEVIQPLVEAEEAPYTTLDSDTSFEVSVTGAGGLIQHVQERHELVLDALE